MSKTRVKRMEWNAAELGSPERREGERSEPSGSGGDSNSGGAQRMAPSGFVPDPEVAAKPARRRFTADYKRSIVEIDFSWEDAILGFQRGICGQSMALGTGNTSERLRWL